MATMHGFKKALAFIFYATGITRLVFYWQFRVRRKILVLLYHEIRRPGNRFEAAVSPENFEKQVCFVRKHFEIVSVSRMLEVMSERKIPEKPLAVITFDDGYRDNLTAAYPVLRKYSAPAIIFIAAESVGNGGAMWTAAVESIFRNSRASAVKLDSLPSRRVFQWKDGGDERLKACHEIKTEMKRVPDAVRHAILNELREKMGAEGRSEAGKFPGMLSWEEVRELSKDPLMEIGSHSLTHRMLAKLPPEEAEHELNGSRKRIEEETGEKVLYVSYPGNSYNDQVQRCAQKAGYRAAFVVDRSLNGPLEDLFGLKRVHIEDGPLYVFLAEISLVMKFFYSCFGKK